MRMSSGHASSGRMAVAILTTSTSSTPLSGFLTFSRAAETAERSRAQQQKVCRRDLNRRDPSTIIPNNYLPAAGVARTPRPTADARCSFLVCAGCGCCGRRRVEEQHGPGTSSLLVRPGPKLWAVLVGRPDALFCGSAASFCFSAARKSAARPRRRG